MRSTRIYSVRKYPHMPPFIVTDEEEAQMYINSGYYVDESVLNEATPLLATVILYASIWLICWLVCNYLFGGYVTNAAFIVFGLVFAACWYRSART